MKEYRDPEPCYSTLQRVKVKSDRNLDQQKSVIHSSGISSSGVSHHTAHFQGWNLKKIRQWPHWIKVSPCRLIRHAPTAVMVYRECEGDFSGCEIKCSASILRSCRMLIYTEEAMNVPETTVKSIS